MHRHRIFMYVWCCPCISNAQWWRLTKPLFDTNQWSLRNIYHGVVSQQQFIIFVSVSRHRSMHLHSAAHGRPTPIPRMADGLIAWSSQSHRSCWTRNPENLSTLRTLSLQLVLLCLGEKSQKALWKKSQEFSGPETSTQVHTIYIYIIYIHII